MSVLQKLAFGLAISAVAAVAAAQQYPTRNVNMIVPYAAGGPTDTVARVVAQAMTKPMGQSLIVENRPSAGGILGPEAVKNAKPDGYTILIHHIGMATTPTLYRNLRFNPLTDFEYIGLINEVPMTIIANEKVPAKNLKEFLAYLKANKDKVNQAHAGVGSVSHTTCVLLSSILGVKTTVVAYKGTGPALNDLVGGQVDYMCDQVVNVIEQVRAGTIKAYAIATEERSPALPDLPTTKEAGLPEFEVSAWNAIFAPKGTPKEIVAKLNDAYQKALADEGVRKRLLDLGSVLPTKEQQTPEALGALVKSEVARWTPILKEASAAAPQ
jgi:tripartite-type tricarboxylate transporter receptor subunit TctC